LRSDERSAGYSADFLDSELTRPSVLKSTTAPITVNNVMANPQIAAMLMSLRTIGLFRRRPLPVAGASVMTPRRIEMSLGKLAP
jgi:hypothetical protein